MLDKWKTLVGVLTGLAFIITTAFAVDRHYAKEVDHVQLAQDFRQYVVEEQKDKVQQRIWDTEDRIEKIKSAEAKQQLKQRLRELNDQKGKLDKQATELKKQND